MQDYMKQLIYEILTYFQFVLNGQTKRGIYGQIFNKFENYRANLYNDSIPVVVLAGAF